MIDAEKRSKQELHDLSNTTSDIARMLKEVQDEGNQAT